MEVGVTQPRLLCDELWYNEINLFNKSGEDPCSKRFSIKRKGTQVSYQYLRSNMVRMTGLDLHFCPWGKIYGVAAVQPAASDSPPDCRI